MHRGGTKSAVAKVRSAMTAGAAHVLGHARGQFETTYGRFNGAFLPNGGGDDAA